MRKETVKEYLNEVEETIQYIRDNKAKIENSKDSKSLFAPKVSSSLSLLRSCLDYLAQDVYDVILRPTDNLTEEERKKKKKYFPYGKNESGFKSMVGNYLPKIENIDSKTYHLVESIQPHKSGDYWLYNLCSINNTTKHDEPNQEKQNVVDKDSVKINDQFVMKGPGSIIVKTGGSINGKKVDKDVIIGKNSTEEDMIKYNFKVSEVNCTTFTFRETGEEVLSSLTKFHKGIEDFQLKLYEYLDIKG